MGLRNFNRQIDIILSRQIGGSTHEALRISCPSQGRKPNISITGQLTDQDTVGSFEIRIVNFYCNNMRAFDTVEISAGYENQKTVTISGAITSIYTESPGPDKVTVINGQVANSENLISKYINLNLKPGFTLKTALQQMTSALGFEAPDVDTQAGAQTAAAPLQVNGTVKDAFHEIKRLFPGVDFTVQDNTLRALTDTTTGKQRIFTLAFLSGTPQLAGDTITLTAPWDPRIRPGDFIKVKTDYYAAELRDFKLQTVKAYMVNSISFDYSTINGSNEMTITATLPSEEKA